MPSILPNYEYDIFISYRQNDNKRDGWVTNFVQSLKDELEATLKNQVSIYFDENPHDGLLDTHQVGASLEKKLKCLVFIPIISQTYCDTASFAWQHEFMPFLKMAGNDNLGMNINLDNGNVMSRVLPVQIHDLDSEDQHLLEKELSGPIRSIDFIYQEPGVNRPLKPEDKKDDNLTKTNYHNQINKVANALKDIGKAILSQAKEDEVEEQGIKPRPKIAKISTELIRRNVVQAGLMYLIIGLLLWKVTIVGVAMLNLSNIIVSVVSSALVVLFPVSVLLAWFYENSPTGLIRSDSTAATKNPFSTRQKKPLTSNTMILSLLIATVVMFIIFPNNNLFSQGGGIHASEASIGIIPFRNNTGDKELNHYGVGLASEVRTELSLSKQFDFISSLQSTIRYQNSNDDPQDIGKTLGVTHIVSGMYQMVGTNMRVIVEMVEAATGKIVWSLPYETNYNDLFQLQADIAGQVMDKFALQADLARQVTGKIVLPNSPRSQPTQNMEAYRNYAKGMEINFSTNIVAGRIKALPYFERAVQLDSSYLDAWRELIFSMSYYYFNRQDSIHSPDKIRPYYNYVVDNFPESWQKNEIKGVYAYQVMGDYKSGLEYFEKALKENPLAPRAFSLKGAILKRTMKLEAAIKNRAELIEQSPNSVSAWNELAVVFGMNGDYVNEEKALLKIYELNNENISNLYRLKRQLNSLESLPENIKHKKGKAYPADLLYSKRSFNELSVYLDSVALDSTFNALSLAYYKAWNFFSLENKDSSSYYAGIYLKMTAEDPELSMPLSSMNFNKHNMLVLNGKKTEAEHHWDEFWQLNDEDLLNRWNKKWTEVFTSALFQDYEIATKTLREMNQEFPKIGDYQWLNLPAFDRIKEEYPTFQEAINSLVLPPKLSEVDRLKM